MSELMCKDDRCPWVVGCPAGIEVVHAATAVHICVYQQEYCITWNVPDGIADRFHIRCCQITVYTECIITGIEGSVLEDTFTRNIRARFFRYQADCPYVEVVSTCRERRSREQGFCKPVCICYEFLLFIRRVSFSNKNKVHFFCRIAAFLYLMHFIGFQFSPVDEDTFGIDLLFQQRMELHVGLVACRDLDIDRYFRERNGSAVCPRLCFCLGLFCRAPFFEQRIEAA